MIKEIENKEINKDFKDFQSKLNKEKEKIIAQKNVLSEDEYKKIISLEDDLKIQ